MKKMKKVEIVIESIQVRKVIERLDKCTLPGYTIFPDIAGTGAHGRHDVEELTDVTCNSYIMVICTPKDAKNVINCIEPLVNKFGGICFTSDVEKITSSE